MVGRPKLYNEKRIVRTIHIDEDDFNFLTKEKRIGLTQFVNESIKKFRKDDSGSK